MRSCLDLIPRVLPNNITKPEFLDMLSRFTISYDLDVRRAAFLALKNIVLHVPSWQQDVISVYSSFIRNNIPDSFPELLGILYIIFVFLSIRKNIFLSLFYISFLHLKTFFFYIWFCLESSLQILITLLKQWRAFVQEKNDFPNNSRVYTTESFYFSPILSVLNLNNLNRNRSVHNGMSKGKSGIDKDLDYVSKSTPSSRSNSPQIGIEDVGVIYKNVSTIKTKKLQEDSDSVLPSGSLETTRRLTKLINVAPASPEKTTTEQSSSPSNFSNKTERLSKKVMKRIAEGILNGEEETEADLKTSPGPASLVAPSKLVISTSKPGLSEVPLLNPVNRTFSRAQSLPIGKGSSANVAPYLSCKYFQVIESFAYGFLYMNRPLIRKLCLVLLRETALLGHTIFGDSPLIFLYDALENEIPNIIKNITSTELVLLSFLFIYILYTIHYTLLLFYFIILYLYYLYYIIYLCDNLGLIKQKYFRNVKSGYRRKQSKATI